MTLYRHFLFSTYTPLYGVCKYFFEKYLRETRPGIVIHHTGGGVLASCGIHPHVPANAPDLSLNARITVSQIKDTKLVAGVGLEPTTFWL